MNSRIHIFAEQAGLYCDGTPDSWDGEATEKFAKLIINGCIDAAVEEAEFCELKMMPFWTMGWKIRQRFGLEPNDG